MKFKLLDKNTLLIRLDTVLTEAFFKKIVESLNPSKSMSHYLFFSWGFRSVDLEKYAFDYKEVLQDFGFIKVKEIDEKTVTFLRDMFREFHTCLLYVCENPHVERDYGFDTLRMIKGNPVELFKGYMIRDVEDEHLVIEKDSGSTFPSFDRL